MWRGTNSATPGYSVFVIIPRWGRKSKFFLSVVYPVVKAVFWPDFVTRRNPANTRAARLSGLQHFWSWMVSGPLPKQARYQLRYTRLLSCFIRLGVFSQSRRASCCGARKNHRRLRCASIFSTAATRSAPFLRHRRRSPRSPTALHPDTQLPHHSRLFPLLQVLPTDKKRADAPRIGSLCFLTVPAVCGDSPPSWCAGRPARCPRLPSARRRGSCPRRRTCGPSGPDRWS